MFAVGVDVSNGRSMVAVLGARRSVVVQPHEVPHTADGFAELAARLHALDGEVRIVMEHTGRYCYYMNAPCSWQPVTGEGDLIAQVV